MHKWQLLLTTTLVAGLAYGCESSLKLTTVLNPAQNPTESEAPSGAADNPNSDSTNSEGEQNKDDKDLALTAPQLENAPPQVHAAAGAMNPLIFVNKGLPAASCLISPPLPTGLGIDTHNGTCRISGTPVITHPKTTHTVTAQDAGGGEGTASVDIEITAVGPPHLEDSGSQTFVTTVGGVTLPLANTGAVVVACTISPALPTGLSIAVHEGSCQISGTPTVPHPTTVHTVTASSSDGSVHSTMVTITVDAASPPVIADAGAQNYIRTVSSVSLSFSNTGSAVQSCSVSPALPAGLTLAVNAGTCRITGTPSATHAATVHTVTATAADGSQDTANISIEVVAASPPVIGDISASQGYVMGVSSVSLSFTNTGSAVQACSVNPALPAGLSLGAHASSCRITGTPSAAQPATVHTLTAVALDGSQDTATVSIAVVMANPPNLADEADASSWEIGVTIDPYLFVNSGSATVSCSIDPALPAGLTLTVKDNSCEISGEPTEASTSTSYTVTATATDGSTDTATMTAVVSDGVLSCPAGYIPVPAYADDDINVAEFCVMKYEAKNVGGVAVSQATGLPWTALVRGVDNEESGSAWKSCHDLGAGFNLISNAQWQSVARQIETYQSSPGVYVNWSNQTTSGDNYINIGRFDSPSPDYTPAPADVEGTGPRKRTHTLPNGEVIWDLAGNVQEFVRDDLVFDYQISWQVWAATDATAGANCTLTCVGGVSGYAKSVFGPVGDYSYKTAGEFDWSGGLGMIMNLDYYQGLVLRGGTHNAVYEGHVGIFAVSRISNMAIQGDAIGFRCVYEP